MNSDDTSTAVAVIILIALFMPLAIWWEVYKYKECRKVGHATFYCVFHKD